MMTTEQHLTDGEVIGMLDDALPAAERTRADEHLATCVTCRERMQRQRRRQQRLSALLQQTDFAVPNAAPPQKDVIDLRVGARRRRDRRFVEQPWLRVAAGLVLLLGATMLIPPVQAAVVGWLNEQWSRLVGDEQATDPQAPPQPGTQTARGTRLEFVSDARAFSIEIAAAQTDGTISVRRSSSDVAIADTDVGGIELLSLPAGVRIVNSPATAANYDVVVPATAVSATIVINGRTVVQLDEAQLASGYSRPVR